MSLDPGRDPDAPGFERERAVLVRFGLEPDRCAHLEPLRRGHIHRTYLVGNEPESPLWVLQSLNTRVFPDPDAVAHNVGVVTDHLRAHVECRGEDPSRSVLEVVPTSEGEPYGRFEDGTCWRLFRYIRGSHAHLEASTPEQAYQTALAVGEFQSDLCDLDPGRLRETIAAFHDTPARYRALESAIESDVVGRAETSRVVIETARRYRELTTALVGPHERGEIPQRIAHNDAKIGNVLFDEHEHPLCVIDLDTVMPGLSLYDFGEMVRSMSSSAPEDDADRGAVVVLRDRLEAMAEGYLEAMGSLLTDAERRLLLEAGRVMTFENGIRFLTDHLEGDHYFPAHHENHNLERATNQFALLDALTREPPL